MALVSQRFAVNTYASREIGHKAAHTNYRVVSSMTVDVRCLTEVLILHRRNNINHWITESLFCYHMSMNKHYGVELILDMHDCDIQTFTEEYLTRFFIELCDLIKMERHGEPMFWTEHTTEPHMSGISAVQFIRTSNIVVHTLDKLSAVYVNIFSCADFDPKVAEEFTKKFFKAQKSNTSFIERI